MLTGERWRSGGDLREIAVHAALVGAWVGTIGLAIAATADYFVGGWFGMDSHAYWLAGRVAHPYHFAPGKVDAFLYSPLFAQVMRPLSMIPWPLFCWLWLLMLAGVAWWLTAPLSWRWRVPALAMCWTELLTGNINLLLAGCLVLAVRGGRSSAIAGLALTKLTPAGVLGAWWLVGRRWRDLAVGVGATLLLAAVSFVAEPGLWREWAVFLWSHQGQGAAGTVRLALAALVGGLAAWRQRPAWLALALWLSLPMAGLAQMQPMCVLLAAVRLSSSRSAETHPAESQRTESAVSLSM